MFLIYAHYRLSRLIGKYIAYIIRNNYNEVSHVLVWEKSIHSGTITEKNDISL